MTKFFDWIFRLPLYWVLLVGWTIYTLMNIEGEVFLYGLIFAIIISGFILLIPFFICWKIFVKDEKKKEDKKIKDVGE